MLAVDVPILRIFVAVGGSSDATAAIACTMANPATASTASNASPAGAARLTSTTSSSGLAAAHASGTRCSSGWHELRVLRQAALGKASALNAAIAAVTNSAHGAPGCGWPPAAFCAALGAPCRCSAMARGCCRWAGVESTHHGGRRAAPLGALPPAHHPAGRLKRRWPAGWQHLQHRSTAATQGKPRPTQRASGQSGERG
jgi:hypothetical protein